MKVAEKYSNEIEGMKDQVRMMLVDHQNPTDHQKDTMNLIDSLERLGISYHFEADIEHILQQLFNRNENYGDESYDLYIVAVHFRIFRQHGYRISASMSLFHFYIDFFKYSKKISVRPCLEVRQTFSRLKSR